MGMTEMSASEMEVKNMNLSQSTGSTARDDANSELVRANHRIAMRVSTVSIVVNVLLTAFKLAAGIIAHSGAMVSDAVHSASDVLATFIVIAGVNISSQAKDKEHPYGHDRMECVAGIILSAILMVTGAAIGYTGIVKIINMNSTPIQAPGVLALVAAVTSILVKEWMYWYTIGAAKKINSSALKADAWHHRSDAISSVGSLVGIAGARLGFPILDPIAAVVIAVLIVKVAVDIGKDSISRMLDSSVDDATTAGIRQMVLAHPKVQGIDDLRTRTFGACFYVDLEIAMDGEMRLKEAHAVAEDVHDELEAAYPTMKHCMIHVNPTGEGKHE